jgi:hypothetical protein
VRDADPLQQLLYGSSERRCVDGYAEKQKSTPPMDLHRVEERNLNDSCTILLGGGFCRVCEWKVKPPELQKWILKAL